MQSGLYGRLEFFLLRQSPKKSGDLGFKDNLAGVWEVGSADLSGWR